MLNSKQRPLPRAVGYIVLHRDPDLMYYRENPEHREQRTHMLRTARSLKYRLARIPVEHLWKSGCRLTERPALVEVVRLIRNEGWQVLIFNDMEHLGLNDLDAASLMLAFRRWSVQAWEARSGRELTADVNRWRTSVEASDADRVKRSSADLNELAKRATRSSRGTTAGRKPFGALPGEEKVLARICQLHRRRSDGTRPSYHAIAEQLNAEQQKPRRGKRWYGRTVLGIIRRMKPHLKADEEPGGRR